MDAGLWTVSELYKILGIDKQWSRWEDRGFVWVGYRRPQRIWADLPVRAEELQVARVNVETTICSAAEEEWRATRQVMDFWATLATLSGIVYERGVAKLRCSMWVHDETRWWVRSVLQVAALLQVHEAERLEDTSLELGWWPAAKRITDERIGTRQAPDELLENAWFVATGQLSAEDFLGEVEAVHELLREQGVAATHDGDGVTAEFPVGPEGRPALLGGPSDLLVVTKREQHPLIGEGVLFRLHAWTRPRRGGRELAWWELNALEYERRCGAHLLGSWCSDLKSGGLTFVSFVPAIAWRRGAMVNLVLAMGVRSHWLYTIGAGGG